MVGLVLLVLLVTFAVRVWSNLCICSPGVVELVKSNLAPDFPLFHATLALVVAGALQYLGVKALVRTVTG